VFGRLYFIKDLIFLLQVFNRFVFSQLSTQNKLIKVDRIFKRKPLCSKKNCALLSDIGNKTPVLFVTERY